MTERETNKIVSENLNYVKSVANQYRGNGVEFDDLVSEGTLAMIMAARKFDETRGSQFVAYASPFIRKAMQQAIDKQSALYRVPKDQKKYAPRNAAKAVSIDAPLSVGNQYTLLDILVNKDARWQTTTQLSHRCLTTWSVALKNLMKETEPSSASSMESAQHTKPWQKLQKTCN